MSIRLFSTRSDCLPDTSLRHRQGWRNHLRTTWGHEAVGRYEECRINRDARIRDSRGMVQPSGPVYSAPDSTRNLHPQGRPERFKSKHPLTSQHQKQNRGHDIAPTVFLYLLHSLHFWMFFEFLKQRDNLFEDFSGRAGPQHLFQTPVGMHARASAANQRHTSGQCHNAGCSAEQPYVLQFCYTNFKLFAATIQRQDAKKRPSPGWATVAASIYIIDYLPESFSFRAASASRSPRVVFSMGVVWAGASSRG